MAKKFYEVKEQMGGVYSLTNCYTCMYLIIGKEKALVSDATNPTVFLFLPESTKLSVYIDSVKRALQKDFDFFLVGHIPKLFPKTDMEIYLRVAEHLDWENGKSQTHPLRPGVEIRQCTEKGKKPGKKQPYVVISQDKL